MARFVVDITPLRRYRHFRRLWAGQMVSGLGSQLTLVAVSFQAYGITHSTLVVGLIGLAQLVPLLAGALWGGTLADAMDRRTVLILTQLAMASAVAGLVVNASLAHPAVWPLFVCTGAGAGFQGVDWPARRAALPMLVGEADVTAAIALQTTIQQLALVAGPALAGVLIATIDSSIVLIAMPNIFRGIGLDPLQPGNSFYLLWMILGFLVVTSVLVVSLGRLGDMYGRVKMYNLGFAL